MRTHGREDEDAAQGLRRRDEEHGREDEDTGCSADERMRVYRAGLAMRSTDERMQHRACDGEMRSTG